MTRAVGLAIVALSVACTALAGEPKEKQITLPPDNALGDLKPGPGVETVRNNCVACHSTDFIVLQPRSDAKQWEAEVRKMITVFGAPISEADAKVIVQYLATAYGPAPKASPGLGKHSPPN